MISSFENQFLSLTGFPPMKWQRRLFERFVNVDSPGAQNIPTVCYIPTGLGKTSVIVIWLLALVEQAGSGQVRLPRRLVYVVNRRTVVDQATLTVEGIRQRLLNPNAPRWQEHADTLHHIATSLGRLCAFEESSLAVSTLRGELADNEEWKADPARPAIVVGTIDMIGSKLLFSGYGDGRYGRTHHAGLVGQDSLIVHDEAHLTPAFSQLLRDIAVQTRSKEPRPVRIMELSATQRDNQGNAFELLPEDEQDPQTGVVVKERLDAKKRLRLHKADDLVAGLVEKAMAHRATPSKLLIYVQSPEHAQKVAGAIQKALGRGAESRVALLTGTIRGYERDRLVRVNPVYLALLDPARRVNESVFLVSTSAGEVGIDLDAEHMVCDLAPLDSMIQRLGRVNRRGCGDREACVDVVYTEQDTKLAEKPSSMQKAVASTLQILEEWIRASGDHINASPRNLRALVGELSKERREAAFSPKPDIPPLTDILLDNWSLTSIDDMTGRPEVAAYLHGFTSDPPETYVVWRKEVMALADASADGSTLSEWFRACRIEAHERLRDHTERVSKALAALLSTHRKRREKEATSFDDFPVVLVDERGRAEWSTLSAVADRQALNRLHYRTLVLPVEAGGLDAYGTLSGSVPDPMDEIDVAEYKTEHRRRERWVHIGSADGVEQWRRLLTEEEGAPPSGLQERERISLRESPDGGENEFHDLVLLESAGWAALENPETARFQQTLAEHTATIKRHAEAIADRLGLDAPIKDALVLAACWHDRGKNRTVWQCYARNQHGAEPLAKSTRYLHAQVLGGYRHEFGSLLEAMVDNQIANHPERDLILHLIAAHHGWARPHFERRAFDNEGPPDPATGRRRPPTTAANERGLVESLQRFGRLQQRFGRWGLAWLESLLRCADIAASRQAAAANPDADGTGGSVPGGASA